MQSLLADVRYALRLLRRSPGFTLVALASLALGIGVNTSIFSLVNALLLRPLPIERPESIVSLYTSDAEGPYSTFSYLDYADLRDQNSVFSGLVGHSLMLAAFGRDGARTRLLIGEVVTGNYFDVLGVRAAVGRTFLPEEDRVEGARPVAVLAHGLWKREFGGDPSVIGRTITIRGLAFTVIGVAPPKFKGMVPGLTPELWIPSMMLEEVEPAGIQDTVPSPSGRTRLERRGSRWMFVRGRLKPGVSMTQAQANVEVVMSRLEREHPETNKDRKATVTPSSRIHPQVDAGLAPVAALVMGVVGLVLLVACANVASMLLARANARRREVGVRLAIGVARGRLVRQLLTESAVLALLGGAAGLALAYWCNQLLLSIQPPFAAILTLDLGFDARVLLFTLAASILTGAIFGLAPALQASRLDLVAILKDDGSAPGGERRRFGFRQALVVTQVAVSMVLLVAGGLLVRSLSASRAADLGFPIDRLAVSSFDLDMARYPRERADIFWRQLDERLRARPEIESVALAGRYPLSVNFSTTQVFVDGQPNGADDKGYVIDASRVSAGYFRTLGVALLEGRDFSDADTEQSPQVAVVTSAFARRFWPNESAVGKRVRIRVATGPVVEIVGVVADHKFRTIGESPRPVIHLARSQQYAPYATVIVKGRGDAVSASVALRRELLALEPNLLLVDDQTMTTALGTILFPVRVGAILLGAFGLLALSLAAIGLYGAIAYSVSRRTREIGVRMALGASAALVLRLVLRQGLALVAVGIASGGILALVATRVLANALYGVGAADPATYFLAASLLVAVAVAANLVPAIRAARVDPLVALRQN